MRKCELLYKLYNIQSSAFQFLRGDITSTFQIISHFIPPDVCGLVYSFNGHHHSLLLPRLIFAIHARIFTKAQSLPPNHLTHRLLRVVQLIFDIMDQISYNYPCLFVWGKYLYEEYNVLVIILVSGKDPQGNIFKSVLTHT